MKTTEQLIKLQQDITKLHERLIKKKEQLIASCTHPEEYLTVSEHYYSGSYDDRASTEYTTKCGICGKIVKTEEKSHSWYG